MPLPHSMTWVSSGDILGGRSQYAFIGRTDTERVRTTPCIYRATDAVRVRSPDRAQRLTRSPRSEIGVQTTSSLGVLEAWKLGGVQGGGWFGAFRCRPGINWTLAISAAGQTRPNCLGKQCLSHPRRTYLYLVRKLKMRLRGSNEPTGNMVGSPDSQTSSINDLRRARVGATTSETHSPA